MFFVCNLFVALSVFDVFIFRFFSDFADVDHIIRNDRVIRNGDLLARTAPRGLYLELIRIVCSAYSVLIVN